jgi:aryl-alcohol dehydrogenase-like predicted oxidoreductase
MRLPGDAEAAAQVIAAAVQAGITVFDTARAYPDNECVLARGLRACGAAERARIVTKGGMARTGGAWIPDGRAKAIAGDCEASLEALDGLAIDLYLIHAPDPRTPWNTSVRALSRLLDAGLVRRVGLSNVNRRQLDEALEVAPITAVEVSFGLHDDTPVRGGILERCAELGIALVAHSPLGGPRRAHRLGENEGLRRVAERHGVAPAQVAIAWLLSLSPVVVAIPGATRPERARAAAAAGGLALDAEEMAAIAPAPTAAPRPARTAAARGRSGGAPGAEVVVVMGIPGAGKSRLAQDYLAEGYLRLNRDERGGKLRGLAVALDELLSDGGERVVLDNTYLTRAARSYVIEVARRHELPARCVWLDVPLAQAQVNLVERILQRYGELPPPEELRVLARSDPSLLLPTSQMRALRELEPPSTEEGFAAVERVEFQRTPLADRSGAAVFVAASVLRAPGWQTTVRTVAPDAPHLVFDWNPGGAPDALDPQARALRDQVTGPIERRHCPHGAGPPTCWCRPPLPGLPLAFAHRHATEPSRSTLIGTTPTHRTLAAALGARYVEAMSSGDAEGH